jgi:hypothetical protein
MNRAKFFPVVLCWYGGTLKINYNLPSSSENNLERSLLLLLSVLFHNLASSCNAEMTNNSHAIMYGGQCPILRTSKFMSVYCIYDLFEANDDNLEEELLICSHKIRSYTA